MGSCFSKRKRIDAAVTHNASPRSSFGLSCKGDGAMAPLPLRTHKPGDEIVVVLSKDSVPLLAGNTQSSASAEKNQTTNAHGAQKADNVEKLAEGKGNILLSQSIPETDSRSLASMQKIETHLTVSQSHEASVEKMLAMDSSHQELADEGLHCRHVTEASTSANELLASTTIKEGIEKRCTKLESSFAIADANESHIEDKEMVLFTDDEFVIEVDDADHGMPASLAKLKRSRSCEEAVWSPPKTKNPSGRRSFQETSTVSPSAPKLETIPEPPQYGATKFLEGLDLVDVLPHRLSHGDAQSGVEEDLKPALLDLSQHDSHDLSADFFAFKNRYLSSCALSSQTSISATTCRPPQADDRKASASGAHYNTEDDIISSFGLMHSRASSLDSVEHIDMTNSYSSNRHLIDVVEEEDENECGSDESETFEFKHAVPIHVDAPVRRRVQLSHGGTEKGRETKGVSSYSSSDVNEVADTKEESGFTRTKELSVVATGDALLYTGSNSEEFDLIPSRSYVRGSPKRVNGPCSNMATNQDVYYNLHKRHGDDDQEKQQQSSLSVDDIILLLEKDELDEDILLSFLNLAKATMPSHGGTAPSCPTSDVASEASFEFKIKSSGSTPHSTPSTPMLSAGSTPKHITQLSPLALTSEEIAEIWGVFEQRQVLSPSSRCSFP